MALILCYKLKNLKKYFILLIIFILVLIICKTILYYKTSRTFTNNIYYNSSDFNGDGLSDEIRLEQSNSKISTIIDCGVNKYILKDRSNSADLFDINSSFKIKINKVDFNRDNIPEILISGFKNNLPIIYIYKWDKNDFINIYTSNNNILGVLDSCNSRSPILLSTQSSIGDGNTTAYMLSEPSSLRDITFSNMKIPALSPIQKIIDIIELTYELDQTPGIFTNSIKSESLGLLWTLDKLKYRYSFQSGYFTDTNFDKDGNPTQLQWQLSFEKASSSNGTAETNELILIITTTQTTTNEFKISDISIKK